MITKKDIPNSLLDAIEPIAQSNLDLIQLKKEINTYYCFIENDELSTNYFKIYIDGSSLITNYNPNKYLVEFKPSNNSNARSTLLQDNVESITAIFEIWVNLIRKISETPSVHDDNFIKFYSDYFFNENKIIDIDAEILPFSPTQQELIELYIETLISSIDNSTVHINPEIKSDIILDLEKIIKSLSSSTKNKVMRVFSNVYAKLYKESKSFTKELIKEAKNKLFAKLIDLGIEYGPKIIEEISKFYNGH